MTTSSILVFAVVPLIVWRMYSRIRRLIGRQKSRAWRHWATVLLCPLLCVLLGLGAFASPLAMLSLAGGILAGVVLGLWGLRLTRFEKTAEGFFYTPNAHIGIALSLILVVRIGFRLLQVYSFAAADMQASMQTFSTSALTLAILGTMLFYYTTYAAGLLRWRRRLRVEELSAVLHR